MNSIAVGRRPRIANRVFIATLKGSDWFDPFGVGNNLSCQFLGTFVPDYSISRSQRERSPAIKLQRQRTEIRAGCPLCLLLLSGGKAYGSLRSAEKY